MLRQTYNHLRQSIETEDLGQVFAKHLPVACTSLGNGKLDFSEFLPLGRVFGSLLWPSTLQWFAQGVDVALPWGGGGVGGGA